MPEYKANFLIKADNPQDAAQINQMLKHMAEKMDKAILLKAAHKINADPVRKVKRMETGVLVL